MADRKGSEASKWHGDETKGGPGSEEAATRAEGNSPVRVGSAQAGQVGANSGAKASGRDDSDGDGDSTARAGASGGASDSDDEENQEEKRQAAAEAHAESGRVPRGRSL